MAAWTGRLLRIDLTTRTHVVQPLDEPFLRKWLGGRGLGAALLVRAGRHALDPFDPRAPLILATGPLTGSTAPGSARTSLTALSPLTGTLFDANSGGHVGIRLKGAGYDALWIEGRAKTPVRVAIDGAGVRFDDATDLWGRTNEQTRQWVKEREGPGVSVLSIGPAGEHRAHLANICNDGRFFGRGGLGALWGDRNLKAISVKGRLDYRPADPTTFDFVTGECRKLIAAHPVTARGLPQFGTPVLMNVMNQVEALPVRNFRRAHFTGAHKISGEALRARFTRGNRGCPRCDIKCGRAVELDGVAMEGPEFETLWAFGANLENDDLASIIRLNRLCNELGLDTISTGATIAAAHELFEAGKLDDDPLAGGIAGLDAVLDAIAHKRGPAAALADGSRALCRAAGAPEASMAVKGLEMPAYDPRGAQGQGLAYATSNRGGCHLRAYMVAPEILATPKLVDRFAASGKAGLVIVGQNLNAAMDSLVLCRFTSFALKDDYYARLLSAATGMKVNAQELMRLGERIYTLERLVNEARGVGADADRLPPRLTGEPLAEGPGAGKVVELEKMLAEYYRFRGWDEAGRPTREKLAKLDLDWPPKEEHHA